MENLAKEKSKLLKTLFVLAIILCAYFTTKALAEIKGYRFIGGGLPASNTISFSGKGEVSGKPDLATISFNIREESKEVGSAQTKATAKEKAVIDFLAKAGIDIKDIKTEGYNSYPKYDYGTPCYRGYGLPCVQESPQIIGYEVSEYVSVKVRDIGKAGEILKGLGSLKVAEMNGPNFSIENEEKLKEQARRMAIEDAKAQAKTLSRDLGVRLVRIVNFSDNGNYPTPMYYGKEAAMGMGGDASEAPALPTGENKVMSNVTITYEIR